MTDMPESPKPARRRLPTRLIWIASTAALCLVFALAVVSPAHAETSAEEARRYTLILQNVFDVIRRYYVDDVDSKKLFEGAMKGMFESLGDPHSLFLGEAEMSDLNDTTQGSFGGVGLYINKQIVPEGSNQPAYVEIAAPIEDTPGWRAGISPGDLILSIDDTSTATLTIDEVLARLRGIPGTEVTIRIRRGEKLEFPVTLKRAIIEVPSVKYDMIGKDVGYIRIITFTPNTLSRVKDGLESFKKRGGYTHLVIDLRNNYGGLLQSAVDISDLFLDGGVVVSTKSRIPEANESFEAAPGVMIPESVPVVVLINRASASASEILAGALKDRGRAYLIGEKSYGKGSVQQVYPIGATGFKMTTARYYTPSDVNIDKIGIPPDKEVLFPELTDTEIEGLNKLIAHQRIPEFVKQNPKPPTERLDAFIAELSRAYGLGESLLRRLVRDEMNRTHIAPVYDLEYDIQLKTAVDLLRAGQIPELMKGAKTLKQLQSEAAPVVDEAKAAEKK